MLPFCFLCELGQESVLLCLENPTFAAQAKAKYQRHSAFGLLPDLSTIGCVLQ